MADLHKTQFGNADSCPFSHALSHNRSQPSSAKHRAAPIPLILRPNRQPPIGRDVAYILNRGRGFKGPNIRILVMENQDMAKVERIRELVTGSVDLEYVRQKTEAGWKLVAMEFRRELPGDSDDQAVIVEEIPYGLRVASDCSRLEEDPEEREVLVQMMELIVQDYSITLVASELNKRRLRTRSGSPWTPVSVFNMLPRLIEVGPQIFTSDEWDERRKHLLNLV